MSALFTPWSALRLLDDDGTPFYLVKDANGCPLARLQHCAEDAKNASLFAAGPELLAVTEEAKRIFEARLVLRENLNESGEAFTEAQKLDARAFLSKREAVWFGAVVDALAKVAGGAT